MEAATVHAKVAVMAAADVTDNGKRRALDSTEIRGQFRASCVQHHGSKTEELYRCGTKLSICFPQ